MLYLANRKLRGLCMTEKSVFSKVHLVPHQCFSALSLELGISFDQDGV